jgi:hypothetical protein
MKKIKLVRGKRPRVCCRCGADEYELYRKKGNYYPCSVYGEFYNKHWWLKVKFIMEEW